MGDLSRSSSTHPLSDGQPLKTILSTYCPESSVHTQRFHPDRLYLVSLAKYHTNHWEEVLVIILITLRRRKTKTKTNNKLLCANYFW